MRRSLLLGLMCAWLAQCATEAFPPRRISLVSPDRKVDQALSAARQAMAECDLDHAEASLHMLLERYPHDPVVPLARALLARVKFTHGETGTADQIARTVDTSADPSLLRATRLVQGLVAARGHDTTAALSLLRPLEGQLPDRAETAELSCGLADAEARAGDPSRALKAIATVEALSHEGVLCLPSGLACDQVQTRVALAAQIVARIASAQALADTLDALPAESPMRTPIALRLRTVAESEHDVPRWMAWLGDLPDDEVTAPAVVTERSPRVVIGILAPISGLRALVGAAILRGVQLGLEGVDNIRTVPEDEGDSPEEASAALDRLVSEGARVVIGISREDLGAAAALRAQALGVDLWELAPTQGVDSAGSHIHIAGPLVDARARAIVDAARPRGANAHLVLPLHRLEIHDRIRDLLAAAGEAVSQDTIDEESPQAPGGAGVHIVAGTFGREARATLSRAAERATSNWVFEARSALPGGSATWVGIRGGPGLMRFVSVYCNQVGEPPGELALLAHDAAYAAIAHLGSPAPGEMTLDPGFRIIHAVVTGSQSDSAERPAAAARCPQ